MKDFTMLYLKAENYVPPFYFQYVMMGKLYEKLENMTEFNSHVITTHAEPLHKYGYLPCDPNEIADLATDLAWSSDFLFPKDGPQCRDLASAWPHLRDAIESHIGKLNTLVKFSDMLGAEGLADMMQSEENDFLVNYKNQRVRFSDLMCGVLDKSFVDAISEAPM